MQRVENELRRDWLDLWDGHHSLVEPSIGSTSGVPDTHLVAEGFAPGWVEFKALEDGMFDLRPAQRLWAREYCAHTDRVALVALGREVWYAVPMRAIIAKPPLKHYDPRMFPHVRVAWEADSAPLPTLLERCYALPI